jgi:hypothetical protein
VIRAPLAVLFFMSAACGVSCLDDLCATNRFACADLSAVRARRDKRLHRDAVLDGGDTNPR